MAIVTPVQDSPTALKIVNPLVKTLLRTPLYRLMGQNFMLVTFTGRKTRRQYTTPVAYLPDGEFIYFATGTRWWQNLVGGAPVTLRASGRQIRGSADVITHPGEAAALIQRLLAKTGTQKAYLLGLKVAGSELPTLEEIQTGVNGSRVIVRIQPE